MPRVIAANDPKAIGLGDLVDIVETGRFDARDEACFASFGPALGDLAANRDFLADIIVAELKDRCRSQSVRNAYGPQVVMLHAGRNFIVRANFWPAETDPVLQENGPEAFFYHRPHDHNFSFLTVGYTGPGYWSDYYEFDYDACVGAVGDAVDLRFVERSRLSRGKVLLYRAHRDIHAQLPADALSVSLNIMERAPHIGYRDQYGFDVSNGVISENLTETAIEPLLAICSQIGGENARDLVETYAAYHPSERIQFAALTALASTCPSIDARIEVFAQAARRSAPFVARMAARQCAAINAGRHWITRTAH
ncbi:transposase [Sphingomonas sp. ABOLD]|uniref:Uncharacterized protein n=1 Tax=Sphingomonas trueperi TaxID=53317 RepID=A0A7X6BBP2_9SPHN|nr:MULTISPECIES: transposase [Sphingomonas]NJB95762.1 hypothetical protein [Sphingomonas trueperi]RSV49184.1 transposase [Sphingomonas sp. ABOLD]